MMMMMPIRKSLGSGQLTCARRGKKSKAVGAKPESGVLHFYKVSDHRSLHHHRPTGTSADSMLYAASPLPDLSTYARIAPECIAGWSPFGGEALVDNHWRLQCGRFTEQRAFVVLLHAVVSRNIGAMEGELGNRTAGSREAAGGSEWVHLSDERALAPFGRIPDSDDIIGSVMVKNGAIQPHTYQPMPTHRILSHLGPFRLPERLFDKLIEELYSRLRDIN